MAARKPKIDLLIRKDFTQKYSGRFILWALTVGRYIAIFTELVVIAGVIARFTLDYQRNNITEDILEQQAILESYRPTEIEIRRISQLLDTINGLEKKKLSAAGLLDEIAAITPFDLRFDSLVVDAGEIEMIGITLSPKSFATFLSKLHESQKFNEIVLDSIETGGPQDPSIHFTLTVILESKFEELAVQAPAAERTEDYGI